MNTTAPESSPAPTDADEDTVHIWCNFCEDTPRKAMCGEDLTGHGRSKGTPISCPLCLDLSATHMEALHS